MISFNEKRAKKTQKSVDVSFLYQTDKFFNGLTEQVPCLGDGFCIKALKVYQDPILSENDDRNGDEKKGDEDLASEGATLLSLAMSRTAA